MTLTNGKETKIKGEINSIMKTLSDKIIQASFSGKLLDVEDVKEFIKQLKEQTYTKLNGINNNLDWYDELDKIINKLAG